MAAYATPVELADYMGLDEPPADAERLLERASTLINAHVVTPRNITNVVVVEALRNATCAQVEWWLATGDEVEATARFVSPGVAGADLTTTGRRIAPRAIDELAEGGLSATAGFAL